MSQQEIQTKETAGASCCQFGSHIPSFALIMPLDLRQPPLAPIYYILLVVLSLSLTLFSKIFYDALS